MIPSFIAASINNTERAFGLLVEFLYRPTRGRTAVQSRLTFIDLPPPTESNRAAIPHWVSVCLPPVSAVHLVDHKRPALGRDLHRAHHNSFSKASCRIPFAFVHRLAVDPHCSHHGSPCVTADLWQASSRASVHCLLVGGSVLLQSCAMC
jgi:hypothetical protein